MINPELTIEQLNDFRGGMTKHLGIEFTDIGVDYVCARMPVDDRTRQPLGLLHGGASVVLAETLGSVGAYACIDPKKKYAVGSEINANHVRSIQEGYVYGRATPLHLGRSTQIWDIRITDSGDKLICVSRLTLAVLDLP